MSFFCKYLPTEKLELSHLFILLGSSHFTYACLFLLKSREDLNKSIPQETDLSQLYEEKYKSREVDPLP
jgi:hypothetical protein